MAAFEFQFRRSMLSITDMLLVLLPCIQYVDFQKERVKIVTFVLSVMAQVQMWKKFVVAVMFDNVSSHLITKPTVKVDFGQDKLKCWYSHTKVIYCSVISIVAQVFGYKEWGKSLSFKVQGQVHFTLKSRWWTLWGMEIPFRPRQVPKAGNLSSYHVAQLQFHPRYHQRAVL